MSWCWIIPRRREIVETDELSTDASNHSRMRAPIYGFVRPFMDALIHGQHLIPCPPSQSRPRRHPRPAAASPWPVENCSHTTGSVVSSNSIKRLYGEKQSTPENAGVEPRVGFSISIAPMRRDSTSQQRIDIATLRSHLLPSVSLR